MSNPLAIATVTACLQRSLQQAISNASVGGVPGATVKPGKPTTSGSGTAPPVVNLFLYQVSPNASMRNEDLPTRTATGTVRARPRAALDLHYLLSFSGDDTQLEPQRMLGTVVAHLHANPGLSRQSIRDTIADALYQPILADSNLAESLETVRFTPMVMSLEELSKLWSVFFQTTYALSVAFQASLVLVESEDTVSPTLPVRERGFWSVPQSAPVLRGVSPQAAVRADTLIIVGEGFVPGQTQVRFDGGAPVTPTTVEAGRVEIAIPTSLPIGLHRISVVVERSLPVPGGGTRTFPLESGPLALLLAPTITNTTLPAVAAGGTLTLTLDPEVPRDRPVRLLLGDQLQAPGPVRPPPPPTADSTLDFVIPASTPPGTYPLRVEVDGIPSLVRAIPGAPGFAPALQVT